MTTNTYPELSREELVKLAHHNIPVDVLKEFCNPFKGCWMELDTPITMEEVQLCIDEGRAKLHETPLWIEVVLGKVEMTVEESRQRHIEKVAYFALNDIEKPINIDVGIPHMGCFVEHIVDDGNHRLAGYIFKKAPTIPAWVSGSIEHAQEMGLYFPNEYEVALCARDDAEYNAERPVGSFDYDCPAP